MLKHADAWLCVLQARLTRDGWSPDTMQAIRKLLHLLGSRGSAESGLLQSMRRFTENAAPSLAGFKEHADGETEHEAFKVSKPGMACCSVVLLVTHGDHDKLCSKYAAHQVILRAMLRAAICKASHALHIAMDICATIKS